MHRRPALLSRSLLVVALLAAAACGGDDENAGPATTTTTTIRPATTTTAEPTTTTAPPAPAGLSAQLVQYREDEVIGLVQVQLHNGTAEDVRVTELAVRWEGLEPLDVAPVDHVLAPGQTLDMPARFGAIRCAVPPRADAVAPSTPFTAIGTITVGDGAPEPLRVDLTDPRHIGRKMFRIGCRRQTVEWAATVAFGPGWTASTLDGFPAVTGEIVLDRRHAEGDVAITDMDGSVLLAVRPKTEGRPLVTMAKGDDHGAVALDVVSTGFCTGHALADSKKTFIFAVSIDIGEGEPIPYEVRPDAALQAKMQTVINERCAAA